MVLTLFCDRVNANLAPHGLTIEDLKTFEYDGGNQGYHFKRWRERHPDEACPPPESFCLCGHAIDENCYISKGDKRFIIGNTCIKKFDIDTKKKCGMCEVPHRNTKDNYCNQCRVSIRRYKTEILNLRLLQGKYAGERLVDVLKKDPGAIAVDNPKRLWIEANQHVANEIEKIEGRKAAAEAKVKADAELRLLNSKPLEYQVSDVLKELNLVVEKTIGHP